MKGNETNPRKPNAIGRRSPSGCLSNCRKEECKIKIRSRDMLDWLYCCSQTYFTFKEFPFFVPRDFLPIVVSKKTKVK